MRNTPQTTIVLAALQKLEHATNAQLLETVRAELPEMSATTVHRITNRLLTERTIGATRVLRDGAIVLDSNPQPHHHFTCAACGGLRDIQIPEDLVQNIQEQVGQDLVADALIINGVCKKCKES
jgi:Fur family transcriptional regulator, peroxide stress response regulator